MKKKLFIPSILIILSCFTLIKANNYSGAKTVTAYVQRNNGSTYYAYGTFGIDIGYKYVAEAQESETARTKFTFDLTSIPSNVTISSVSLSYLVSNAGNYSYKFTITQISNYNTPQDIWSNIGNASALFSDVQYNSGNLASSALTNMVKNSKGSNMYLGSFSQNENSYDSGANLDLTLSVSFTVLPTIVTITADNNFTDNSGLGTHGSIKVDGGTYTAPFPFQRYTGTNVTLEAVSPQTDNQGYQRIWNTGSGVLSYWNGNGVFKSYNQTYSFPVSSSDNGATYQAQLRQLSGPKFYYFYQDPDPLYNGGTGYVYAVFSSEVGDITYSWLAYSDPSNITLNITPDGSRSQVHYYIPYNKNPNITLVCTATNAYGSNTQGYTLHTQLYGYSSSASLAFETNGELTDENPILISSVDNPGADVTDYYLINKEITPDNNAVKFLLHETDQTKGHTNLDQVELWEVKANKNEFIAVTDEGEVISYKKLAMPNQIILNDSLDITNVLADRDKLKLTVKKGDRIKIKHMGNAEDLYSVFYAQLRNEKELPEANNNSSSVNKYYFRPQLSAVCKKIKAVPAGGIEIEFSEDLILDYFALVRNEKTAKMEKLNLLSAKHSKAGETASLFALADKRYGEVLPGEKIKFEYETKLNSNNDNTSYILKTVGRYEKAGLQKEGNLETIQELPKETILYANYPNPFNPTTTINYQLPEDGLVTLKVYDVLGKEIATLVNENKSAGYYQINFDASRLTSGVYIYTIQITSPSTNGSGHGFVQSKKMLLLK